MGFFFTLTKILIPIGMITTIGLWITQTVMIAGKIQWNKKDSMREVLYSREMNQMSESEKDQLINNAIGMEVLHLLVHVIPFIVCIIGIVCNHYYTIHCGATFSFIPWVFDDFDVVNRWNKLLETGKAGDHPENLIYIISHFFHSICAIVAIIFAHIVDLQNRRGTNV